MASNFAIVIERENGGRWIAEAPGSPCVLDRGATDHVAIYKAVERGELRSVRVSSVSRRPAHEPASGHQGWWTGGAAVGSLLRLLPAG